jgi:hypothetical protein
MKQKYKEIPKAKENFEKIMTALFHTPKLKIKKKPKKQGRY